MKLSSTKTTTTVTTRKVYALGDVRYTEIISNGKLIDRSFSTKAPKKSHPLAYEPSRLYFQYYEDLSFLDDVDLVRSPQTKIPQPSVIEPKDVCEKTLSNILAIHLSMDGSIYAINSTYPVPMWRYSDYIRGFASNAYDLEGVKAKLETIPWVKDIKVISVPYYNAGSCGSHAIEFNYRVPADKMKKICDKMGQWRNAHAGHMGILSGIDLFGVKKFQIPDSKKKKTYELEED